MSLNSTPQICKIKAIKAKYIEVEFSNGEHLSCFYEDFPYFEDGAMFDVGEDVLLRKDGASIIIEKKRARQNVSHKEEEPQPRKKLKTELMRSFNFKPLKDALSSQIEDELKRIKKENKDD